MAWIKRKGLDRTFTILTTLIAIALLCDLGSVMLGFNGINNLPFAHAYGLIEGVLLITFFYLLLEWKKRTWTVVAILYAILYVADSIFLESIFEFNAGSRSVEALMMIVFCVMAFNMFYAREEDIFIEKSPHFWIVIGILTYFSGALSSFVLSTDMLSQSPDRFYGSWMLHNFSNMLKNVIFTIGLWRIRA
jgi:K+ transporter